MDNLEPIGVDNNLRITPENVPQAVIYHNNGTLPAVQPSSGRNEVITVTPIVELVNGYFSDDPNSQNPAAEFPINSLRYRGFSDWFALGTSGPIGSTNVTPNVYTIESIVYKAGATPLVIIDQISSPSFPQYIATRNTTGIYSEPGRRIQVLVDNYLAKHSTITVEIKVHWRYYKYINTGTAQQGPGTTYVAGDPRTGLLSYTISTVGADVINHPDTSLTQTKIVNVDSHGCSVDTPIFGVDFVTLDNLKGVTEILNDPSNPLRNFTFVPPPETDAWRVAQPGSDMFYGLPDGFLASGVNTGGLRPGQFTIDPYKITFTNKIATRSLDWGTAVYGSTGPNSFTVNGLLVIRDTQRGFSFQIPPRNWRNVINYLYMGNDQAYNDTNTSISVGPDGVIGRLEVSFPVYIKDHILGDIFTKDIKLIVNVKPSLNSRDGIPRAGTINTTIGVNKQGIPLPNYGNDNNFIRVSVDEDRQWDGSKWVLHGERIGNQTVPRRFLRWVNTSKELAAGEFKITRIELFDYDKWKGNFELGGYDFDTMQATATNGPDALLPLRILRVPSSLNKFQGRIHYEFRWSDSTSSACPSYTIIDRFEINIDIESDFILDAKLDPELQIIGVENEYTNRVIEPFKQIKLTVTEKSKSDSTKVLQLRHVPNARLSNAGQGNIPQLQRGEFSILNITIPVNITDTNTAQPILTPTQTQLVQPDTPISVQIEARGDDDYSTTVWARIRRRLPTSKYVASTPTPQEVLVYVDYNNNVLSVSHPFVTINTNEIDVVSNESQPLFYDRNLQSVRRFRIKGVSQSSLITQTAFSNSNIQINNTGTFTQDQTISVDIEYLDSNNIPGQNLVTFILKRVQPDASIINYTISPTPITVDVNERTNDLLYPNSIPNIIVGLTEKSGVMPASPLSYNPIGELVNGQWKITNISFPNSTFSVSTTTPSTPNFTPIGFNLPQNITCYVYVSYVDSTGKPGTLQIPFNINRNVIPNERAQVRFTNSLAYMNENTNTQRVLVSDTFKILDPKPIDDYDELKDLVITGEELLKNATNYSSMSYKDSLEGTSVWTIKSIRIADARTNTFANYIGYELVKTSQSVRIQFKANEIRSKLKVVVELDYIDNYMNEGPTQKVEHFIEPIVDQPIITRIDYPELIRGADYMGFDVNFSIEYDSRYATRVGVYIMEKTPNSLYKGRYFTEKSTIDFNMKDLMNIYNIPLVDDEQFIYDVKMILVPERVEGNNSIIVGQTEEIIIRFDKSNVQLRRPIVLQNLYDVIKPKFDFEIYKDETRKYLTHYLHMDGREPLIIANWEKDTITFSKFEDDELGNQILIEENPTLVLKMYEPLPEDIQTNTSVWITKGRS